MTNANKATKIDTLADVLINTLEELSDGPVQHDEQDHGHTNEQHNRAVKNFLEYNFMRNFFSIGTYNDAGTSVLKGFAGAIQSSTVYHKRCMDNAQKLSLEYEIEVSQGNVPESLANAANAEDRAKTQMEIAQHIGDELQAAYIYFAGTEYEYGKAKAKVAQKPVDADTIKSRYLSK